jgi:crotonobetaine/carnitine-CoA ligase
VSHVLPHSRTIPEVLRFQVEHNPDSRFLKCGGDWLTFRDLDRRSERLAAGLVGLGVTKGTRVAMLVPNRLEFFEVFYAAAKLGAILVPLNAYLKGEFLRCQLTDSASAVLVTDASGLRSALPLLSEVELTHIVVIDDVAGVDVSGVRVPIVAIADLPSDAPLPDIEILQSDTMAISYTSGTTGMPKGCVLSHGYYTLMPTAYFAEGWFRPGKDILITPWPVFNAGGHALANMIGLVGAVSVVYEPEFHASTFMKRVREERATVLWSTGLPGMAVLAQPPSLEDTEHCLRFACFVPMSTDKQLEFAARFGVQVLEGTYGQTETVPTTIAPVDGPRRPGTCGRPVWYLDVQIVNEFDEEVPRGETGEIVVRPKVPGGIFQGYWRKPEDTVATFRNLWHHTGDAGRMDDDGFVTFVDRKKDAMRRRGGINVSSLELEATVTRHPGVAQAAAFAQPSAMTEDEIVVALVPAEGATLTPHELFEFFRAELPYYAVPRYVRVCEQLPTNAMGRVMKQTLRDAGLDASTWDLESLGLTVKRSDRR